MSELDSLLLHDRTRKQAEQLQQRTPNALLITGANGSGKKTLAHHIAADMLRLNTANLRNMPYFSQIDPEGNSISIEDIRELQQLLKLKVPSKQAGIHRVIIIIDAGRMRTEAQNALLKTLEEPPADTCIILTAPSAESLLPTITSRATELQVLPVAKSAALAYFSHTGKSSLDIEKAYSLSQGQAGLMNALLTTEEHPLLKSVDLAKQIMSEPIGKRLLHTESLAKDRDAVRLLLNAMQRIAHAALLIASRQKKYDAIKQWHSRQAIVVESANKIEYNANLKLLLDDLFISI